MTRLARLAGLGTSMVLVLACEGRDFTGSAPFTPTRSTPVTSGSGIVSTEARVVAGVSAVSVRGAGQLIVEHAAVEALSITAEDNILPLLEATVVGGRLMLGPVPGSAVAPTREVVYRLSVRTLSEIEASGASRVEVTGVHERQLTIRLSGASTLTVGGTADVVRADLSGASRCHAEALSARHVQADLSGASYVIVRVLDALVARVSGMSTLEYLGSPLIDSQLSGGGALRRAGS